MAIIRPKDTENKFVDTDEIEDPACMSLETGDPHNVFRDYMLPRIKASRRDEASTEVLAAMNAGRSFVDAVLDAIESLPESETERLRAWSQEARGTHIYPYVRFQGDHVMYGLMLTTGGPMDKAIRHEPMGEYYLHENFTKYWEFREAIKEIANKYPRHAYLFEDNPFVEIVSERQYNEAIDELRLEGRSHWEKSGLYDFRDEPPSYYETLKDYVRNAIEAEAEDMLSSFDTDEIKDTCTLLLERKA